MSREIKFRAWDKNYSEMFTPSSLTFNEDGELIYVGLNPPSLGDWADDEVEIMQYTGLKDKNGKEIYEGDILSFDMNIVPAEIKWRDAGFWIQYGDDRWLIPDGRSCEVIGNIYEHPNLLEHKP